MSTLLSTPIADFTFDLIRQFCGQQNKEHIRLEYKKEFSSKSPAKQIGKEVAAMANTQGGTIIWGVAETEDRLPEATPPGQNLGKNPRSAVLSACDSAIFPPLALEVSEYLTNPDADCLGFLVVRVPPSEEIHTLDGGAGIYRRVSDQSEPIRATIEFIEHWLANRRTLIRLQEQRRNKAVEQLDRAMGLSQRAGRLAVTVGPYLNTEPLTTVDLINRKCNDLSVRSRWYADLTPLCPPLRGVSDGLYHLTDRESGLVDVFGNVVVLSNLTDRFKITRGANSYMKELGQLGDDGIVAIDARWIAERIHATVASAIKIYTEFEYFGTLQIGIRAFDVNDVALINVGTVGSFLLSICKTDDLIEISASCTTDDLCDTNRRDAIFLSLIKRVMGAWGCEPSDTAEWVNDEGSKLLHGVAKCKDCNSDIPADQTRCRKHRTSA